MHEVHVWLRDQLPRRISENFLPGRIDAFEEPVRARDAQHIGGETKEAIQLLLRAFALDEKADLPADGRHHPEQRLIGRTDLAAEEFHHAQDVGSEPDGEAERRMDAGFVRDGGARKLRPYRHITQPGRLFVGPHHPREPQAAYVFNSAGGGVELGKTSARDMPAIYAGERHSLRIQLPERAVFPMQRLADRL